MTHYTIVHKKHFCPMWKINVTMSAKYHFLDESNPFIATHACSNCPVLENLKLPLAKQNPDFSLYRFCDMQEECFASLDFKQTINTKD